MILTDVKEVLGIAISDTSQDNLIGIYTRKAKVLIQNYLKISETIDIETLYPDAIIEFIILCMNKRGNEGTKSMSMGAISATYSDDIFESLKILLPLPYVVMR